jgi:hypothetical protein
MSWTRSCYTATVALVTTLVYAVWLPQYPYPYTYSILRTFNSKTQSTTDGCTPAVSKFERTRA